MIGGFLIWFVWIQAEPAGVWLIEAVTAGFGEDSAVRQHLLANAQHMRVFVMGLVLLLVMRFTPGGILPENMKAK